MERSIEKAVKDLIGKKYSESCEEFAYVVSRISEDLTQVYEIDQFFDLDVDTICQILSNDDLQVLTELDVFKVALKWLAHAIDRRWQLISRVMKCVRFGCMEEKELWRCHEIQILEKRIQLDYCPVIANIIEEESQVPLNTPTTAPRTCFSNKQQLRKLSNRSDKRYPIVKELIDNEKEFVEVLRTLEDKYIAPLKNYGAIEDSTVDNIFHMIPELLTHHSSLLEVLESAWEKWDARTTIGNVIMDTFSKQTVLETYMSFVKNYDSSSKVLDEVLQKKKLSKFLDQCQKECSSYNFRTLSLKELRIRPIQRLMRYKLLIQRLAHSTPSTHPDTPLLKEAEREMKEFDHKINAARESPQYGDEESGRKKHQTKKNRFATVMKSIGNCFRKCFGL